MTIKSLRESDKMRVNQNLNASNVNNMGRQQFSDNRGRSNYQQQDRNGVQNQPHHSDGANFQAQYNSGSNETIQMNNNNSVNNSEVLLSLKNIENSLNLQRLENLQFQQRQMQFHPAYVPMQICLSNSSS